MDVMKSLCDFMSTLYTLTSVEAREIISMVSITFNIDGDTLLLDKEGMEGLHEKAVELGLEANNDKLNMAIEYLGDGKRIFIGEICERNGVDLRSDVGYEMLRTIIYTAHGGNSLPEIDLDHETDLS